MHDRCANEEGKLIFFPGLGEWVKMPEYITLCVCIYICVCDNICDVYRVIRCVKCLHWTCVTHAVLGFGQ